MSNCAACILNCNYLYFWESDDIIRDTATTAATEAFSPGSALSRRLLGITVTAGASATLSYRNYKRRESCLEDCNKGDCSDENTNCNNN